MDFSENWQDGKKLRGKLTFHAQNVRILNDFILRCALIQLLRFSPFLKSSSYVASFKICGLGSTALKCEESLSNLAL